jgi:serine/threonine-protein kinase
MSNNSPEKIGPYSIIDKLGEGPNGEVFKAWDEGQQRTIAVKRLRVELTASSTFQNQSMKTIELIREIESPHIGTTATVGEIGGHLVLTGDYIDGSTLDEVAVKLIDNTRFLLLAEKIVDGLKEIHDLKLVHGNLKPSNIMFGDNDSVHLIDYGFPIHFDLEQLPDGELGDGSMQYLAPEILNGELPTRATDLYSLGVMLYFLAAGHLPFTAKTNRQMISTILFTSPDFKQLEKRGIPGDTILLIGKLLSKKPDDRFDSAGELLITINEMTRFNKEMKGKSEPFHRRHLSPRSYLVVSAITVVIILLWYIVSTSLR